MEPGKFRFAAALAAAVSAFVLVTAGAESSAEAKPKAAGHAKAKQKKAKGHGAAKGKAHAAGASHGPHAAGAGAAKAGAQAPIEIRLPIQRATLENGLRVVMNVDRSSPTIAVTVTYDVGSRDEEKGRSGFAHLFEHLMFHGTANLPKGELERVVLGRGGFLSANTLQDYTNYYMALPSNELAAALWVEADRMRKLNVTTESFEAERSIVEEELRLGVTNAAYGRSPLRLEELVFQGYWPYEHAPYGSMVDLDAAKIEWVKEFYDRHYGPNTAILSISGDFDADQAMELVHRYFDGVPRIQAAPFAEVELPEQTSQRTAALHDDYAGTPGVLYGWAVPPARHADRYALELAAILLGDGESSRLHQLLVRDKAAARSVATKLDPRRGPSLFSIDAKLSEGAKVGDVEKLIEAEVKALGARPPSDAEMEKARRRALARLALGLQWNRDRSIALGKFELFHGDARQVNNELGRYMAVTKDDLARAVAQHLGPTRRTIVETYPAKDAAAAAAARDVASAKKPEPHAAAAHGPAGAKKHDAKKKAAGDAKKKAAAGAKPKKKKKP